MNPLLVKAEEIRDHGLPDIIHRAESLKLKDQQDRNLVYDLSCNVSHMALVSSDPLAGFWVSSTSWVFNSINNTGVPIRYITQFTQNISNPVIGDAPETTVVTKAIVNPEMQVVS
jgi:hypothetical protein